MSLPESVINEVPPAGGFAAIRPRGIPVFVGVAAAGPVASGSVANAQSFGARQHAAIASTYKAGPLARRAAYVASLTNSQCLCIRVPKTARNASHTSATVVKDTSSDFTSTLSGTPTWGADVVIEFGTVGGLTGTGPIAYRESTDGGVTFTDWIALGTATSVTVLGVAVALGSGKVVTAGDTISWFQRAASAARSPVTVTRANSGSPSTATFATAGTPEDRYRVRLEWLTASTYRYALDWDGTTGTWSKAATWTSGAITLIDDAPGGSQSSGVTVTPSSTDIDAGDVVEFGTTAPEAQESDIAAAMTALRSTNLLWSFFYIINPTSATDAGSLDTLLKGWATGTRRTWAEVETRDREGDETISAHAGRVNTDFAAFASTRVFPAAGHAPAAEPVTGRRDRMSAAVDYVSRLISTARISQDPGQVDLGPLPASRTLYDATTGAQREYDARIDPQLFDAHGDGQGFHVLRTWEDAGLPGTYPAGGICMPPAGDLGLVQLRRLLDAFEDAVQTQARLELLKPFRRWTAPMLANASQASSSFKAGDVYEADARAIERRVRQAAIDALVGEIAAPFIQVTLDRTPVSLGGGKFKLKYSGKLTPPGYIYAIEGDTGLVDAAFAA